MQQKGNFTKSDVKMRLSEYTEKLFTPVTSAAKQFQNKQGQTQSHMFRGETKQRSPQSFEKQVFSSILPVTPKFSRRGLEKKQKKHVLANLESYAWISMCHHHHDTTHVRRALCDEYFKWSCLAYWN